jgi:Protein of unknown function (DUF3253)
MSTQDSFSAPPLATHLHRLLAARQHPKTICPSEAARAISRGELEAAGAQHWRDMTGLAREMLFDMRDRGDVEILQGGEVIGHSVGVDNVKGPIRARLKSDEGGKN